MGRTPGSGVVTDSACNDIYDWGRRVGFLTAGFTSRLGDHTVPGTSSQGDLEVKSTAKADRSQLTVLQ